MTSAVLSIGSNLGDRLAHLRVARAAVRPWLVAVSPVVETPPWGPVEQPDYLNAVLLVDDDAAAPADWLARAHAAEAAAHRTRDVRWGPRTLDVDVVAVWSPPAADAGAGGRGKEIVDDDPTLTLPHPRAGERAFVLVPWLAVDPDATWRGRRVDALLAATGDHDVTLRPDLTLDDPAPGGDA